MCIRDRRLTIRQIQAQICYALTGGLSCKGITSYKTYSHFKYGFPNLFFGYQGGEEYADALKVRAIRMLHDMNLDAIALPVDYDLFVKGKIESFPDDVQKTIETNILTKLRILTVSYTQLDVYKRQTEGPASGRYSQRLLSTSE